MRAHVWQVLEKLQEHNLYVKGEKYKFHVTVILWIFYWTTGKEGISMDQSKVCAVAEWPTAQIVKEFQCFLRLTNFYSRIICDFNLIPSPLTSLLNQKLKKLAWNDMVDKAFTQLKQWRLINWYGNCVTSALQGKSQVVPCFLFFPTMEQNYDIGNHQLLANYNACNKSQQPTKDSLIVGAATLLSSSLVTECDC